MTLALLRRGFCSLWKTPCFASIGRPKTLRRSPLFRGPPACTTLRSAGRLALADADRELNDEGLRHIRINQFRGVVRVVRSESEAGRVAADGLFADRTRSRCMLPICWRQSTRSILACTRRGGMPYTGDQRRRL